MRTRHLRAWTLAAAALSFGVAGCGDDAGTADETATATGTATAEATIATTTTVQAPSTSTAATVDTTMPSDTGPATDEGGSSDEFCTKVVEAEQVATTGPDVDFEAATEEEIAAAMEDFSAALLPLLDELATSVPDEIAGDLETVDSALRAGIESGDDPSGQPGFEEADRNIDEFVGDNCGFEVYPVRAVEYAFEDVPESIESGIVGFDLQNEGNELHEFVLFRINDDVDMSVEELLELPDDEAESMVEFIGATFAEPGESDMTFHDLRPGRYGAVCFIPVGTTDMSSLEGEASATTGEATTGEATTGGTGSAEMGPPHFTQGMLVEFEVTEGPGSDATSPTTTDTSGGSTTATTTEDDDATTTDGVSTTTTNDSESTTPSTTSG